jgi:hypothetical protein
MGSPEPLPYSAEHVSRFAASSIMSIKFEPEALKKSLPIDRKVRKSVIK